MSFKISISGNFGRAADIYDNEAIMQKDIASKLVSMSVPYITPNARMIDLGSGTGFIAKFLQRTITQIDISLPMANRSALHSPAVNADIELLPIKNDSMDIAFSSSTLQWCNDLDKTFSEVARILKNNGHFCFAVFGKNTLAELKDSFIRSNLDSKILNFHDADYIWQSLANSGFQLVHSMSEIISLEHPNLLHLLKYMKHIGANATSSTSENLTKQKLFEIEKHYRNYFSNGHLFSNWEVLYFICSRS